MAFAGGEGITYRRRHVYSRPRATTALGLRHAATRLTVLYDAALDPALQLTGVDNVTAARAATSSSPRTVATWSSSSSRRTASSRRCCASSARRGSELAGPAFDPPGAALRQLPARRGARDHVRDHGTVPPPGPLGRRQLAGDACHAFGDFDSLAWDLGNPDDVDAEQLEPAPRSRAAERSRLPPHEGPDDDAEPARHGRTTARCTGAATGRVGSRRRACSPTAAPSMKMPRSRSSMPPSPGSSVESGPLTRPEMQAFTDFILQVTLSAESDPRRSRTCSRRTSRRGANFFLTRTRPTPSGPATSATSSTPAAGFFGGDGLSRW